MQNADHSRNVYLISSVFTTSNEKRMNVIRTVKPLNSDHPKFQWPKVSDIFCTIYKSWDPIYTWNSLLLYAAYIVYPVNYHIPNILYYMDIIIIIYYCLPSACFSFNTTILSRLKVGIFTVKVSIKCFGPPLQLFLFGMHRLWLLRPLLAYVQ